MPKALDEVTREAIQLPRQQRLVLAGLLLELDDAGAGPEVDAAWEQEIRARIEAVDDGSAVGISYEDAMRQAQARVALVSPSTGSDGRKPDPVCLCRS